MLREEVKYASKDYVNYILDKQEYHNEDYTEDDIRQAFEKGAMFADNNPYLSSLWHDASEEPKEYPIIYQDEFSDVWILQFSLKNFVDGWEDFKGFECVTRWTYIKDLLPKGDGGGETIL